jgi:molybdopterin-synthase adenylyltransferase
MNIFFHEQLYRTDAVMAKPKELLCYRSGTPCLHARLAADYAEVIWNDVYRVPSDDDVCDYPLARSLVMLTVTVIGEAMIGFITTEEQRHFTVTLKDLKIQSLYL